jgi:hypothetical protein
VSNGQKMKIGDLKTGTVLTRERRHDWRERPMILREPTTTVLDGTSLVGFPGNYVISSPNDKGENPELQSCAEERVQVVGHGWRQSPASDPHDLKKGL